MSATPRDVRSALRELADRLQTDVHTLRTVLDQIGEGNPAVRRLLSAMAEPLLARDAQFPRRLAENMDLVVPLTEYYAETWGGAGRVCFLESGATPAWLAITLAGRRDAGPVEVLTNNRAVSNVLSALWRVWETEGWADTKYYGVFPFTSDQSDFSADEDNLYKLHSLLEARVARLVLDASRFSFLLGPTVNSWQNVCFKVAAYNVPKPIDILLPLPKVITRVGGLEHVDGEELPTLCWHLTNCYTVFEPPRLQPGRDAGRILPEIDKLQPKGAGISRFPEFAQSNGIKRTWLALGASNKALRIWVSGHGLQRRDELKEHLGLLNDTLSNLGYSLRWVVEREAQAGGVWLLVVHARSAA